MEFLDFDFGDIPYDPDYPITNNDSKENHKNNEPVDPDSWSKENLEGEF